MSFVPARCTLTLCEKDGETHVINAVVPFKFDALVEGGPLQRADAQIIPLAHAEAVERVNAANDALMSGYHDPNVDADATAKLFLNLRYALDNLKATWRPTP